MPEWSRRLQVTAEGFVLMVRYAIAQDAKKIPGMRRKLDKSALEVASSMAALVCNLAKEVQEQFPLQTTVLENAFKEAFVTGDANLEVELQCGIAEKSPQWKPLANVTLLKELMQAQSADSNAKVPDAAATVQVHASKLQEEEFALLKRKIEYDLKAFQVWKQKVKDRETQMYFQELNHKQQRRQKAAQAAGTLWEKGHRNMRISIEVLQDGPSVQTFSLITDFLLHVQSLRRAAGDTGAVVRELCSPLLCLFVCSNPIILLCFRTMVLLRHYAILLFRLFYCSTFLFYIIILL